MSDFNPSLALEVTLALVRSLEQRIEVLDKDLRALIEDAVCDLLTAMDKLDRSAEQVCQYVPKMQTVW